MKYHLVRGMKSRLIKMKPKHWLLLVLLFSLALRLYFFVGLNWADDAMYVNEAYSRLDINYKIPARLGPLRSGMIYPTAFFFKLFGINEYSATLYPLLCSLGSIVLTYYFGKTFFDEKTGLTAALLLAVYPLNIAYATRVMPDVPIAFFMALSAYIFLKNEQEKKTKLLYLLSGISIGIAYLNRVSGLMILLFLAPYMAYRILRGRRMRFEYAWVFIGLAAVILAEGIFYSINSGSIEGMTLRYRVSTEYYNNAKLSGNIYKLPRSMLCIDHRNKFFVRSKYNYPYGIYYLLVIPAILYVLLTRDKNAFPLVLWALILFLWSNFGTMSLTEYKLIHRLERHMTIITIPSILILGRMLGANMREDRHIIRKSIFTLLLVMLLTTSLYFDYHQDAYIKASVYDVKAVYDFLKDKKERPVYCESTVGSHLNFHFKYRRRFIRACKDLRCVKNCEDIRGAFIILNTSPRFTAPECVFEQIEDWVLLKTIVGPKIDRYEGFDPQIYYVSNVVNTTSGHED
jgi:4-amino-4-deoxy-L-arabinose transferase-like glycosyltransferase